MFSRLFDCIFFYFDLWGLRTEYPSTFYRNCPMFSYIIFIIHNGFVLFALLFSIYENIIDDTLSTQSHLANDAFKTYTAILTHWIITIESICSAATQRKFWTTIEQMHWFNDQNHQSKLSAFTFFFIQSVLLTIAHEVLFTWTHSHMLKRKTFLVIFAITTHMCLNRVHCYTLHMEIVRTQLERTIHHIRNLTIDQTPITSISRAFRKKYGLLGDSIECINRMFGWSNAATIFLSFHFLLTMSNWTIAVVPGSPLLTVFGEIIKPLVKKRRRAGKK